MKENRSPIKFTPCGARTRRGSQCQAPAMNNGTGRCKLHGGKSRSGVNSPRFKSGYYLKHLPKLSRLREIYSELLDAGLDIYSSDDDMRLLMARQALIMEQGETKPKWRRSWKEQPPERVRRWECSSTGCTTSGCRRRASRRRGLVSTTCCRRRSWRAAGLSRSRQGR